MLRIPVFISRFRRKRLAIGITILVVVVLFWSIRSMDAPAWDVYVIDQTNRPAVNVLVRESYQNYSAEFQGHEEDLSTDAQGFVHFQPKWIRAPLIQRIGATLASALGGVHASFGPYSDVTAFQGESFAEDVRNERIYAWKGSTTQEVSRLFFKSR